MFSSFISYFITIGIFSLKLYAQSTANSCLPNESDCILHQISAIVHDIRSDQIRNDIKQDYLIQDKYCQIAYGSCFIVVLEKLTWYSAKRYCEDNQGRLAEIYDSQLNSLVFIMKDALVDDALWLGGSDEDEEGKWVWAGSELSLNYEDWDTLQPNNHAGNQHCLAARPLRNQDGSIKKGWHDYSCSERFIFLCEYPLQLT